MVLLERRDARKEHAMETHGNEIHVDSDEARSGSTPHIVRYVLGISLALAIVALSAIWITGSVTSSSDTGGVADSARASAEQKSQ
jgi:hypothetical protein